MAKLLAELLIELLMEFLTSDEVPDAFLTKCLTTILSEFPTTFLKKFPTKFLPRILTEFLTKLLDGSSDKQKRLGKQHERKQKTTNFVFGGRPIRQRLAGDIQRQAA